MCCPCSSAANGVADPTNLYAIDEIKFQCGLGIEAIVVEDDKLQKFLDKAIEQVDTAMPNLSDEEGVDLESLEVSGGDDEAGVESGRDDVEDAPIVRFVNKVLLDAIRRGASDIHFEPYEKIFRVRLRIDGVLREVAQPPVQLTGKIAARLKVMSRLDIAARRSTARRLCCVSSIHRRRCSASTPWATSRFRKTCT